MTAPFKPVDAFLNEKRTAHIPVTLLTSKTFKSWLKEQSAETRVLLDSSMFEARPGQNILLHDPAGNLRSVLVGTNDPAESYDLATASNFIRGAIKLEFLAGTSFYIENESDFSPQDIEKFAIGWGLAAQSFDPFKPAPVKPPCLLWPQSVAPKRVSAFIEAIGLTRYLINLPANLMGPEELENAVRSVADMHSAALNVVHDADLLDQNFQLIHAVGDGSPRRPRLLDLRWGNPENPALCLVGKGVCFDTGGLDIKPSAAMRLMKKDMGGAAHALGVGYLIMALELPVNLRILIPAVENAVGGAAFRPGDIFKSRKGLSVEITNTDAEGRLVLADALTYACESTPELIMDFATLTGSARAALGPDIPAFFTNMHPVEKKLKDIAFREGDPVWPMPLWGKYKKHIQSTAADLHNSASTPGDLIYSALFLEQFLDGKTDWIHMDLFAWENSGVPGRPAGGSDTGLRAAFAFLEDRYGR